VRVAQVVVGVPVDDEAGVTAACIAHLMPSRLVVAAASIDDPVLAAAECAVVHVCGAIDERTAAAIVTLRAPIVVSHRAASHVPPLRLGPGATAISVAERVSGAPLDVDRAFAAELREAMPGPIVCCVDPIDADYPLGVLLGAHHLVCVHHDAAARLVVAGADSATSPGRVERVLLATQLDTVWRTATLSAAQYAAVVEQSDAVVALSPAPSAWLGARSAMALGTAVVVLSVGALASTVGDAGLVLDAGSGASVVAEALMRLLCDDPVRARLEQRGRARAVETRGLDAVGPVLAAIRDRIVGSASRA
jgi:glycosyltransferase involved in cell wall biosynthesis